MLGSAVSLSSMCIAVDECGNPVKYTGAGTVPLPPGAKKFDQDKAMLDLLLMGCPDALLGVADVLTYGFKKYGGKHGWKQLPDAEARYMAALMRHLLKYCQGETHDEESGLPHMAHMACNAMFLIELTKDKKNAK